jgi:hypothetical protein
MNHPLAFATSGHLPLGTPDSGHPPAASETDDDGNGGAVGHRVLLPPTTPNGTRGVGIVEVDDDARLAARWTWSMQTTRRHLIGERRRRIGRSEDHHPLDDLKGHGSK